jgi:hypothetical protein
MSEWNLLEGVSIKTKFPIFKRDLNSRFLFRIANLDSNAKN